MRRRSARLSCAGVPSTSDSRDSVEYFNTRFTLVSFLKRARRLSEEQKKAMEKTGFGNLLRIPNQSLNKSLLLELMHRWDSKKHSFALPCGDIRLTPKDVVLTLGLRVVGVPAEIQDDEPFLDLEAWFGADLWKRSVTVASVENRLDSLGEICNDDFVRTFLLFTFGNFLFPNADGKVDTRYLSLVKDVDRVQSYAWGQAVLAHLVKWLDKRKETDAVYVGGCLLFLQIWSFEHIDIARPALLDVSAPFPRVCQWDKTRSSNREQTVLKFKDMKESEVTWELELTSWELEADIVKELLEAQSQEIEKELLEAQSQEIEIFEAESPCANSTDNNHGNSETRRQFGNHEVIQSETESETSRCSDGQSKQEVDLNSPDALHCCSAPAPAPCTLLKLQKQPNQLDVHNDLIIIIDDEDERHRVRILEDQNMQLNEELQHLKKENELLKSSRSKLEEDNSKLKRENDDLIRKNQALSLSGNDPDDLADRLKKILLDY